METEKEGPKMHSVSVSLLSALTQNPRYQDTSANYGIPMRRSNQNFTAKSSPLSLSLSVSLCVYVSLSFLFHGSEISVEQTVFCSYSNGKETYQTNKEIASFIPASFIPFLFFLSFFHRNRNSDNKPKLPNSAFAALTNTKIS
jgi:hypothetical protein